MSTNEDQIDNSEHPNAASIETARIEQETEQSYIDYAMSVIAGRALPDARDGLKPVQRRILYSMDQNNITHTKSHRKSSSIVGDTMGNYHPHGDKSIYDALVRMAQGFSMRYTLVDGQGNFGSIDDDPPAAMRYTEARLDEVSQELLRDLNGPDSNTVTVPYSDTYDDRGEEPDVLPSRFPNLLINGSSGIAVGMSTKIPPHNTTEIINATLHLLEDPEADVSDLMNYVKGPDFPTGGELVVNDEVTQAYETGRGKVKIRGSYELHDDRIIITEVPYEEKKSRLVEKIANDVKNGTLDEITDIRDESDKSGVRIVIDLKKNALPEVVENKLLDRHLEQTYGIILLALDKNGQPRIYSLKELLEDFIEFRTNVIRRRSESSLADKEEEKHLLEGRLLAVEHAEDIVELIRNSDDRETSVERLTEEYELDTEQAEHICRMQLGSLTGLEEQELKAEYEDVTAEIERLESILNDEETLRKVIKDELTSFLEKYGDERKTSITHDTSNIDKADLIPEEDVVLTLSNEGYVKRMSLDTFPSQKRNGKGRISANLKEGDSIIDTLSTNTHNTVHFFTDEGNVYEVNPYDLEENSRNSRGTPDVQYFNLNDDEQVVAMTEYEDSGTDYVFLTSDGHIKRTDKNEYDTVYNGGLRAISLAEDAQLLDVISVEPSDELFIESEDHHAARYDTQEVNRTGRATQGVSAMSGSEPVAITAITDESNHVLTITDDGRGKRTTVDEYRKTGRPSKGVYDLAEADDTPVSVHAIDDESSDIIITTENAQTLRTSVDEIRSIARNSKGVSVMNTEDGDNVVSVEIV